MPLIKYTIGVDEAGRGPLAGPVAVGVALVAADFDWRILPGVGDSKKLSPQRRAVIFNQAQVLKATGQLNYSVALVGARVIDQIGIVPAIKRAMHRALKALERDERTRFSQTVSTLVWYEQVQVKLDGGLKAPAQYLRQETIIGGDDKELVIGLASIMAKVTRDRYMERIARKPEFLSYNFAVHKGYGTKLHRHRIKKHGLSPEHRVSFCRNIHR